jgi:HTH-type transcriptional repressor of NAD biosynthesis genes
MRARHGLVIGKFYPPHAGHHLLVRAASACSERVTVVVMASSAESVPMRVRESWMREVHAADGNVTVTSIEDDLRVDLTDDRIWEGHVALMREAARAVTDEPVDVVFTSEAYGDELARRLGARHAPVDVARRLVPTSGTSFRSDPIGAWEHLAGPVRGGLARRVVIVGAESTGKTTLAADLAGRLRARGGAFGVTRAVWEVGREVTAEKLAIARASAALAGRPAPEVEDLAWETADFVRIAAAQDAREEAEARIGGPVLICDTDAFATGVWHERYVGSPSELVPGGGSHAAEPCGGGRPARLYLLTDPDDVPFVQDGLRDGEHLRRWMTGRFASLLTETGRRWAWLRGDRMARVEEALARIDELVAEPWMSAPLPEKR